MAVTVKFITRRAGGRESVRPTVLDRDIVTIGRDTGSDIQLSDLRVALKHARLTIVRPGVALIEAEAGRPLKVGGRLVDRKELKLAGAPTIEIGGYALTLEEGPAGPEIAVERKEAAAAPMSAADAARAFTLRRTLSKRWPAWILTLLVAVGFLALPVISHIDPKNPVAQAAPFDVDRAWLSGSVSLAHANIANDCAACHDEAFVSVRDETCLTCHDDVRHHAEPERLAASTPAPGRFDDALIKTAAFFGKPADRCSSCHAEHNGADGLIQTRQALCSDCHGDLDARLSDASVRNAADFGAAHPEFHPTLIEEPKPLEPTLTRTWSIANLAAARAERERLVPVDVDPTDCDGFQIGKPNFRGLPHLSEAEGRLPDAAKPGDDSGLVFPHDVHLDQDGCVATLAIRLGAERGYGAALECADCHVADAGDVLFDDIRMERHCSACHSLTYESDAGFERTLRHGQPRDVIANMRDFYQAQALSAVLDQRGGDVDDGRRRPGEAAQTRVVDLREAAFAEARERSAERVRAIFSEGGACYGCHEVERPAEASSLDFRVKPVSLRGEFLPKGYFDHGSHDSTQLDCADCHDAATSQSSTDVLLPDLASCQECHGGEHVETKVASTCLMCHQYHDETDTLPIMATAKPVTAAEASGEASEVRAGGDRALR